MRFGGKLLRHLHQFRFQFIVPPAGRQHIQPQPPGPRLSLGEFFAAGQVLANLLPVLLAGRVYQQPEINFHGNFAELHLSSLGNGECRQRQMKRKGRLAGGLLSLEFACELLGGKDFDAGFGQARPTAFAVQRFLRLRPESAGDFQKLGEFLSALDLAFITRFDREHDLPLGINQDAGLRIAFTLLIDFSPQDEQRLVGCGVFDHHVLGTHISQSIHKRKVLNASLPAQMLTFRGLSNKGQFISRRPDAALRAVAPVGQAP